MTATWVIGVDGSDDSRHALEWAVTQAEGRDVTLLAVSVWHVPATSASVMGGPGVLVDWSDVEAAVGQRLREIIAAAARPGVVIEPVVVQGGASWSLIDVSRDTELLVVGSRGLGGFKRLVLGSVSRQCATHATVPTVVVPLSAHVGVPERIVVGVDGSANSAAALEWALGFAAGAADPDAAAVDVIGACEISPWTDPSTTRERFPKEVEEAERQFEAFVDRHVGDRKVHRAFILHSARQALTEATTDCDLVVLGARGHGAVGAAILGSVTTWMLHNTRQPVVVVPEPAGREPAAAAQ